MDSSLILVLLFPFKFILSKIRAHVASCSKYQSYIMEGVKATTKDASLQPRYRPTPQKDVESVCGWRV